MSSYYIWNIAMANLACRCACMCVHRCIYVDFWRMLIGLWLPRVVWNWCTVYLAKAFWNSASREMCFIVNLWLSFSRNESNGTVFCLGSNNHPVQLRMVGRINYLLQCYCGIMSAITLQNHLKACTLNLNHPYRFLYYFICHSVSQSILGTVV